MWLLPKNNTAYAGENIWTWAGVSGGVDQIITDPLNPSTVYAVISNERLMRSTDGGNSWTNVADPDWAYVGHTAMAFSAPNVLYARASSDSSWCTYRSTDGGMTWQLVYPAADVTGVAVSPLDWREAYLADSSYESSVISKTTDGGQSWTTLSTDLPPGLALQSDVGPAIAIAPSAPHILIAKPSNTNAGASLYKSTDGGRSWSEMPGPYDNVNVVTFDPKNSNTIYLGTHFSPGGWKSTDGGSTWQPLANGLQPNGLGFVVDPDNTEVVHVANGYAGVLESLDGGTSWTSINTGIQGLEVRCIAIASRNPLVIYAGLAGGGIWKMTRTTVQDFSITIDDGALFTNQTAVTLTLAAPSGTTEMIISNDGGFGGATWEPFASQKPWTITVYGEYVIPRVVYAKFRTSGQISGLYQDDIILDVNAPTGSVEITDTVSSSASLGSPSPVTTLSTLTDTLTNTVHLPVMMRNARPGHTLVGLALSGTDDVSGVAEMLISNDASFADAQWKAYVTEKNWWVPNTGTTTVYVKFRDRAGNDSVVYSDTVTP
jgi:photosystem II stability/assembly factor-like uncharacterized protein